MSKIGSLMLPLGEQLVAGGLDDRRPRVEVLVDAVAEAHQAEAAVLVLGHVDVLLHVAAVVADLLAASATQASLAPPCSGPHKRTDAGRDRGEQVRVATSRPSAPSTCCSSARGRRARSAAGSAPRRNPDRPRTARSARRTSSAGSSRSTSDRSADRRTAGRSISCRRRPRSSAAWPAAAAPNGRPAPDRAGRANPGRTSTARRTTELRIAIGWASRGKPS